MLADYIGIVSSVLMIFMMFTGVPVCLNIHRNKNTGPVAVLPYVAGYGNGGLWLSYGILTGNPIVWVVSAIGVVLNIIYTVVFYIYAKNKRSVKRQALTVLGALAAFGFYVNVVTDPEFGIWLSGVCACVATVGFIATPLAELGEIFRTKSTASIPVVMVVGNLVLSVLNFWYGYLIQDTFMLIPNALGILVSTFIMSLFVLFPSKPVKRD